MNSIIHCFGLHLDESQINVNVELYSILLGHEETIYGLCWRPSMNRIIFLIKDLP